MGKGGTRFLGDAIGARSGRPKSAYTSKELKKNMEKYLESGVHPDVERAQRDADRIPQLPDTDIHRQYVFLDISIANKPIGRVVIELFDDIIPAATNHFRNRCLPGSAAGLAGASFHKILPNYAAFAGKDPKASEGMRLQPFDRLRSVEPGTVSISLNGDEIAFALARALNLDATHQVVGRVTMGKEVLEAFNDVRTNPDDSPAQKVQITKSGATNPQGTHDSIEEGAGGPPKDVAAQLKEASADARSAVMDALEVGLVQKRKPDDASAAAEILGAPGPSGTAAAGARNVKARLLDSMLGDISSNDSSDSDAQ